MSACLPPGWQRGTLGDVVAAITAGVSVNGEDRPIRDGEVGVLKITAVLNGRFEPHHHKAVLPADRHRIACPVRGGTVLVSRSNTIDLVGASAYVPEDLPGIFLPDLLWEVRPLADTCPRWLAYVLADPAFRPKLLRIATGTSASMKKLSQGSFLSLPVIIPPRREQEATAAVLRAWDDGIAAAESLVRLARLHVAGLTARYLDAFIPGTTNEDTALPQVPLGDVFEERVQGGSTSDPLLAITGDRGVVLRDEIERRDTSAEDKSAYRLILPGDIGYNTMRMWQGVCGLSSLRGVVSPAYTVVTPRTGRIDGSFAAALFKAPHMIEWLRRYSQGIVDDTLNLKFEQFRQVRVRLPPLAVQQRIARVLHAIRAEADVTTRLASRLRDQKGALMSQLLSGDLRVPDGLLRRGARKETADA